MRTIRRAAARASAGLHHGERYGKERVPTHYFTWNRKKPFHLDYRFAPSDWHVEQVAVGNYARWSALSDHRPLIVDIVPSSACVVA